ncbi:MAG: 50S ribosomal protein L29 [Candidatus Peregrinibacteria bacterium]|nr:50S ribosomal protein L29 [Candidatus Peregrinibacteria bacterium]
MKISEIRQLAPKKLKEALDKARRDLSVARFHVKTGQNKNTSVIKKLKKMIAQMLTILNAAKK